MRRSLPAALITLGLFVLACDEDPTGLGATGSLVLQFSGPTTTAPPASSLPDRPHPPDAPAREGRARRIDDLDEDASHPTAHATDPARGANGPNAPHVALSHLDSLRVRLSGPSTRTEWLPCSATTCGGTINNVTAGDNYTVTVEGIDGTEVASYGSATGVNVPSGGSGTANITNWGSFRPSVTPPASPTARLVFNITLGAIGTATGYTLWVSRTRDFTPVTQEINVGQPTVSVAVTNVGWYYFQARATNAVVTAGGAFGNIDSVNVTTDIDASGDAATTAANLGFGESADTTLSRLNIFPAGDADWFSVDACVGDVLVAETRAARLSPASTLRPGLSVTDRDATTVLASDAGSPTTDARVQVTLPATGTYRIRVGGIDGVDIGNYELQIDIQPGGSNLGDRCSDSARRVTVTPGGSQLTSVGATQTLLAEAFDDADAPLPGKSFIWTSGNPNVATVSSAGVVTAVASGQTTINATVEGVSGVALVTVAVPGAAAVNLLVTETSPLSVSINGAWGTASDNFFAVGNGGSIIRYDGAAWSSMANPEGGGADLLAVWGSSPSDVFAVGTGGIILHYNGTAWTAQTSGLATQINDVWGLSGSQGVYAVTTDGRVLRYNGSSWATDHGPLGNGLWGVWGSSPSNIFAVGGGGSIERFDGTSWNIMPSNTSAQLLKVWGSGPNDIFAVGTGGTIVHYNGASWSVMASGVVEELRDVWGTSSNDVYASGTGGTLLRYDGTTWSPITTNTLVSINALFGTPNPSMRLFGSNGAIRRGVRGAHLAFGATPSNVAARSDFGVEVEFLDADNTRITGVTSNVTLSISNAPGQMLLHASGNSTRILDRVDPTTPERLATLPNAQSIEILGMTYEASSGLVLAADLTSNFTAISPTTGSQTSRGTFAPEIITGLAFDGGGRLLGVRRDNNEVYDILPTTGAKTSLGAVTGVTVVGFTGLAWNPVDGKLYGAARFTNIAPAKRWRDLVSIDPGTLAGTLIGRLSEDGVSGLAFTNDGTLFAVTGDGSRQPEVLWKVEKATAKMTRWLGLERGDDGEAIAAVPAHLSGTVTVAAVDGLATFSGLQIDAPGTGLTLSATSSPVNEGFSTPIDINAGAFTSGPATGVRLLEGGRVLNDLSATTTFTVDAYDAAGSPVSTPATWSTLNSDIVSITPGTGVIAGLITGQATVAATVDGATGYGLVTVLDPTALPVNLWDRSDGPEVTTTMMSVFGFSASDVWAVGGFGTGDQIWHWNGSAWTQSAHPLPSSTTLWSVWGSAPNDVWVVGVAGAILHWDGTSWTDMSQPSSFTGTLWRVWGTGPNDVFAVGDNGAGQATVLHWDGSSWTATTLSGGFSAAFDVWGLSPSHVWAVGASGSVFHYDGLAWTHTTTLATANLFAVWGTAENNIYAAGSSGANGIFRYDGTSWNPEPVTTSSFTWSIWGRASDEIYAVGGAGQMLRYDGVSWKTQVVPTGNQIRAVWGTSNDNTLWTVGANGEILRSRGPINIAYVDGAGSNGSRAVFVNGDLLGSATVVDIPTFNSTTPADLRSAYDVVVIQWNSIANTLDADWTTRLEAYMNLGGGVIFEDPTNVGDLAPAVTGTGGAGTGTFVLTAVPGLTDGVTTDLNHSHYTLTAWDASKLTSFITHGGVSVGLYGRIGAGCAIVTGVDPDFHAFKGASDYTGNEYNLILNELRWAAGC